MKEQKIQFAIRCAEDFHLDHVFDCGQCFRWRKEEDGSYTGIAGGKIANIAFDVKADGSGVLTISNASEADREFWHGYLDLDRDYGKIKEILCRDDPSGVMKNAISYGGGIRILQQDPWEAVICFIISQNNNIPRIKKCIESLCEAFGEYKGTYRDRAYYDYPAPEVLASLTLEDLAPCKLGYRAKYLIGTGQQAAEQGRQRLNALKGSGSSFAEAFDHVTGFTGVGPKVANCILLFSLGKYESFPIDVWMKKVMIQLYGLAGTKEMTQFARMHFGEYGGFAQQYLFYYMKENSEIEEKSNIKGKPERKITTEQ